MSRNHIETLTDLAERRRTAVLRYRPRLTPSRTFSRVVEPYSLTQGKEDVMVRAYQLQPVEGWRCFMAHKIDSVEDAGTTYEPRRDVTMAADAEVTFGPGGSAGTLFGGPTALHPQQTPWTEALLHYRDLVADALAEGTVDHGDFEEMRRFAKEAGLREEQVRYVHAYLFHRVLGAILRDGTLNRPQLAELRFVQRVFKGLGWGVGGERGEALPARQAAA